MQTNTNLGAQKLSKAENMRIKRNAIKLKKNEKLENLKNFHLKKKQSQVIPETRLVTDILYNVSNKKCHCNCNSEGPFLVELLNNAVTN